MLCWGMVARTDRTRADLNKVSNAKRIAKLVRLYYSVLQRRPTYRWLSIPSGLVVTRAPTEWNGTRRCASASQRHFLPSGLSQSTVESREAYWAARADRLAGAARRRDRSERQVDEPCGLRAAVKRSCPPSLRVVEAACIATSALQQAQRRRGTQPVAESLVCSYQQAQLEANSRLERRLASCGHRGSKSMMGNFERRPTPGT